MNKKQTILMISSVVISISLSGCIATQPTTAAYNIATIESGSVTFSKLSVQKQKAGYKVTGEVKRKAIQIRQLKVTGSITVTLKAADGSKIESIKARYHSKYGGTDKVGHFDAMLKNTPPVGSRIVVEYHR